MLVGGWRATSDAMNNAKVVQLSAVMALRWRTFWRGSGQEPFEHDVRVDKRIYDVESLGWCCAYGGQRPDDWTARCKNFRCFVGRIPQEDLPLCKPNKK